MASGRETYDYVIVGAGSAGCTLAYRLTEDPSTRVLLLEAGGWDRDPWIHIPLGWGRILDKRLHDWMYFSEPEPNVDNRRIECARGKVIGGSSSINAMAYVRGNRADYDRWAGYGLTEWSFAHVLPYFRRQESWEGGASIFRGGDGPLAVRKSRYADPLTDAFIAAGEAAGWPATDDYNGLEQEGFSRLQSTIRDGKRCSNADAYLTRALRRRNLTVRIGAHAERIRLDGKRAIGVRYRHSGRSVTVDAAREVILAGGVINTPQLLMLSGIGDPDDLQPLGITVVTALKGVGKNLQDHVSAIVSYSRKQPGPFVRHMRLDRIAVDLAKAYFLGDGFATDLPSGVMGFVKSGPDEKTPDLQMLFHAGPLAAGPYLPPFTRAFADGFSCRIVVLRPESRGWLKLASADPFAAPRIYQNFLAAERDWERLRAGIRIMREIGSQAPLQPFVGMELSPGPAAATLEGLDTHIRNTAITVHHPCGTCKMGIANDGMSVVDPELRVHGIDGLRVIDASVMPDLVGGNINATVTMIAEKGADLIRGIEALPPTNI